MSKIIRAFEAPTITSVPCLARIRTANSNAGTASVATMTASKPGESQASASKRATRTRARTGKRFPGDKIRNSFLRSVRAFSRVDDQGGRELETLRELEWRLAGVNADDIVPHEAAKLNAYVPQCAEAHHTKYASRGHICDKDCGVDSRACASERGRGCERHGVGDFGGRTAVYMV